jgi:hypothetical protein
MAQRVQVLLVCDVHGDDTEGTETITFSTDGSSYEIDLCDRHAGEYRDAIAPYVAVGRRTHRGGGGGGGRRHRGNRSSTGFDPAAVRAWAKSSGVKVSERGRISAEVLEQFHAAGH